MSGVNKVILLGNLGKDPQVRTMNDGNRVVSFTLATSESWKDKNTGDRKEKVEWHNVVIFNDGIGKIAEQYLKKGSKCYVEGQLSSRKYTDQSGSEKYITEVVLQRFRGELTLLDSRERNGGDDRGGDDDGRGGGEPSFGRSAGGSAKSSKPKSGSSTQRNDDPDQDIPF